MNRSPRLPNSARIRRVAPGQMHLWNRPSIVVLLPHGRSLSLLQGGRGATRDPEPVMPVRKAA